jgi:hypothetical protein
MENPIETASSYEWQRKQAPESARTVFASNSESACGRRFRNSMRPSRSFSRIESKYRSVRISTSLKYSAPRKSSTLQRPALISQNKKSHNAIGHVWACMIKELRKI